MKYLALGCIIHIAAGGNPAAAQNGSVTLSLAPGSYVAYEAPITIGFVASQTVTGVNENILGDISWSAGERGPEVRALITIDAAGFGSGNATRDRDVRNILSSGEFPEIIFELTAIYSLPNVTPDLIEGEYIAAGDLTVRGVTKRVNIGISMSYGEGMLRIRGAVGARYSDFQISPPRVAGFIGRAPDELLLRAHLLLRIIE